MREKDERIQKLEAELRGQGERARRLQGALTARVEEAEASGSAAAAQRSNFHMRKYKTLRDDYRKLLEQRAGMVGRRAHGGAQQMVGELQQRRLASRLGNLGLLRAEVDRRYRGLIHTDTHKCTQIHTDTHDV